MEAVYKLYANTILYKELKYPQGRRVPEANPPSIWKITTLSVCYALIFTLTFGLNYYNPSHFPLCLIILGFNTGFFTPKFK